MISRVKTWSLALAWFVILPFAAQADVRKQSACGLFPSSLFPNARIETTLNTCYSGGHRCWVGVRGDWLDLTDRVTVTSGPTASITIDKKGVEDSGTIGGDCIPRSNKDREGFVRLNLENIRGTGTMRLRLSRPGGEDTISVTVKDGTTFLATKLESAFATAGESKVFELKGGNLRKLQLKQTSRSIPGVSSSTNLSPSERIGGVNVISDEILSKTETSARVRLTLSATGMVSLEEKLQFSDGEPELNKRFGWPTVNVSAGRAAQNPPPAQTRPPGGGGATITQPNDPNLTPQQPSIAPLLNKIGNLSATMIPMFYCTTRNGIRVLQDQDTEVDVPAFDWGVANDNRADVNQAFSVVLLNGSANNAQLASETVQSIVKSGTRIFRNWPGRPARVHVMLVTAANPKFAAEYNSSTGCYIPTAFVGSTRLDPKSLVVRVDSGDAITEHVENDNDLTRR